MAETNATILIPDISGFTEFMTTTELGHASHAINMLIDAMLEAVGEEYEVSEIEGDAVLLIKKGPAPSKKEIIDTCIKIFNAFHFQRKWMQQHTICPCGACQAIIELSLKFVAHHGPLAEIKIGKFIKQSGPEMIVAHRLLKNSINNNEYLLLTEKLLEHAIDTPETLQMEWFSSSEEYASIGKIDYRFVLLNEARKKVPEPPEPENRYVTDNSSFLEIKIAANFHDVYMVIMDIPGRFKWLEELKTVTQDYPGAYIGSTHLFKYDDYEATISPLRMNATDDGIIYAERCKINEQNLSLVYEFVFKNTGKQSCIFAARILNEAESPLLEPVKLSLFKSLEKLSQELKLYCEKNMSV